MAKSARTPLYGDEGMWLLNALPYERIKKLHTVSLPQDFGESVMKLAVRMNNGGSASFVSNKGLIMTNHHVGHELIGNVSTSKHDYVKNGFYAKNKKEEIKIPQLEVNVLHSIEDVTVRVQKKRGKERTAEIALIETESKKATGLRSDVVELYQGGAYHLYRYKKYTDVRLVFAPEKAIATFGGDFDNYEFPRYSLDVCFFRVYDNGAPLVPEVWLTPSSKKVSQSELLFIAGHPGRTDRLTSYAALSDMRDRSLPYRLNVLRRLEILFDQYAGRSPENARRADKNIATVKNLRKRYVGQLDALHDPAFMKKAFTRESEIKKRVFSSKKLKKHIGDPWSAIGKALQRYQELAVEYDIFESLIGYGGHYDKPRPMKSNWTTYLGIARTILRLAEEDAKPSNKRLPEFADARRESLLEELYVPTALYDDLEAWKLADALKVLLETYGEGDAVVAKILNGTDPHTRAQELIRGTSLKKVSARKALVAGGTKGIKNSGDSMINLAQMIDARARAVRKRMESEVKDVFEDAYAKIAEAQFSLFEDALYPDATFTLRLAYGVIKPFKKNGVNISPSTAVSGIIQHGASHDNIAPWRLSPSWDAKRAWVSRQSVPFNFVSTHDSHGGNSGSPVFTKNLECVGVLFDGIQEGQGSTFMYGGANDRSVSVSMAGILAILRNIYKTKTLILELFQKTYT